MSLPDVAKGETGRPITITWLRKGTTTAEPITGAVLSGFIRYAGSSGNVDRAISGGLAIVDGANGIFTWTLNATDTQAAGKYLVHFVATFGSGAILKSFFTPWEVVDAGAVAA